MKSKKILALALASIIASGGINQISMQVYADNESSISKASSTVKSSPAFLIKRHDIPYNIRKILCKPLKYANEENLAMSTSSKLIL